MTTKETLRFAAALIGFLLLIFDSSTAISGAREGLQLCLETVIPSLLPFFFLSGAITSSLSGPPGGLLCFLARLLRIPEEAAGVLIPGFLGGYPVGAKAVEGLYCQGRISYREAGRLLSFCSNPGPAFLFGMVTCFFPDKVFIWLLWAVILGSAILTALCIPGIPEVPRPQVQISVCKAELLRDSLCAMSSVCGWVILFRTVIAYLQKLLFPSLTPEGRVLLTGFAELTNGCCDLGSVADTGLRFVLCACMLSFGGLCVLCQTATAAPSLPLEAYLLGKLSQTFFAFLLSCALVSDHGLIYGIFAAVFVVVLRKIQNRDSIPGKISV